MLRSLTTRQLTRTRTPSSNRTIWLTSTILSTSPTSLLSHLQSTPLPSSPTPPSVLLYAISKNVPSSLISSIQATLSPTPSIGCLSEVPSPALSAFLAPSLPTEESYSISLATFHPTSTSRAIPFLSTLFGRPNISVGREIKSGPREDTSGETIDGGFEAFLSGKKWGFGEGPAEGRRGVITELQEVQPKDVKQIVSFAADRTQPFLTALTTYSSSANIGLIGSSTPFHSPSHAPFSLFFNDQLVSSGAVGVAIIDSAPSFPIKIDYSGLEAFSDPMEVTSAKGNIVLTLSSQNAARLLLKAVQDLPPTGAVTAQERAHEKEKEFFAAVFDSQPGPVPDLSRARHVSQIMAGDPSRGAMSVMTEEEVKLGYYLLFLHRPSPNPRLSPLLAPSPHALTFLSTAPSEAPPRSVGETPEEGEVRVVEGFVVASENGVVLSRMGSDSWVCGTEGAVGRVE